MYKKCFVPNCNNNSLNSNKIYTTLPRNPVRRKRWFDAARRTDFEKKLNVRAVFCCEDHFNLKEDAKNWQLFKFDGLKLIIKDDVVPHLNLLKNTNDRNVSVLSDDEKQKQRKNRKRIEKENLQSEERVSLIQETIKNVEEDEKINEFRVFTPNQSSADDSYLYFFIESPNSSNGTISNNLIEHDYHVNSTTADISEPIPSTSNNIKNTSKNRRTDKNENVKKINKKQTRMEKLMTWTIEKDPKIFLGLSPSSYHLIKTLTKKTRLPHKNVLITLKKIHLDLSFDVLGIYFGISETDVIETFKNSSMILSSLLKQFILWPDKTQIKRNVPIQFRNGYEKVVSIIDCVEIEIEKPSSLEIEALTWSDHRRSNTIKYLISCTPDGLISFVSNGYVGQVTDEAMIEDCGYLSVLPPGTQIMADDRLKNISNLLHQKKCELIRLRSEPENINNAKRKFIEIKRTLELRVYIERIFGRLKQFKMIHPVASIDNSFIQYIDYVMQIVCGIINIQDRIS